MKVNEIFYSLQGEGYWTGTPAVFVRLSGCNRACAFCDTDFSAYASMSASEIIAAISAFPARHVVLTGGEPALQIDDAFVKALKEAGFYVQIETNGSLPVPDSIDWVTCSPKAAPWNIQRIDELKLVYTGQDADAVAAEVMRAVGNGQKEPVMCLQPCSGLNIAETIAYIKAHPRWRLSLQTHKLLNIR